MRHVLVLLALTPLAATAQSRDIHCNIESDYNLSVNGQSVILTRDSGTPKWIVIRGERLFVDDSWVALGSDDRKRIAEFDRGTREVLPLARDIGRDAADIAFTALAEVAAGFSSEPARTRSRLDQARRKIDARLSRAVAANRFDSSDLGQGIAEAVSEVVPMVIGDIVAVQCAPHSWRQQAPEAMQDWTSRSRHASKHGQGTGETCGAVVRKNGSVGPTGQCAGVSFAGRHPAGHAAH